MNNTPLISLYDVENQARVMFEDYDQATTIEQRNYNKQAFATLLINIIYSQWEANEYQFGFMGE